MDVREAAYRLDELCGRPYMLMRLFFYGSPILPRAWVGEKLVRRFERMALTRHERAVAAEKAAAGRPPVTLVW
jgi:hypothetical protein